MVLVSFSQLVSRNRFQSLADLGLQASLRPSPRKFSENKVSEKNAAGIQRSQGDVSMVEAPSEMRTPHELIGGGTPNPRKLSTASSNITLGTVSVAYITITVITFGIRCRNMMRASLRPSEIAASTNSWCLSEMI